MAFDRFGGLKPENTHQQRHRLRRNLLRTSKLRRQLRQHLRVLLREFEDALLRFVELDAVAVQLLHQKGGFLRRGLRQCVLQCHGDLRRLAPGLRLVIRTPRVRPRAPRIALPLAFLEMQSAQRREDALAQSGIGGLAETLNEAGDDFGRVHHGEGAEAALRRNNIYFGSVTFDLKIQHRKAMR